MIYSDLAILLKVYLISLGLHFIFWPLTKKLFGKMPDMGWPIARLATTLVAALIIWQLGHVGPAVNTDWGLTLTTLFLIGINWLVLKHKGTGPLIPKEIMKLVVMEEYLFLVGLVGITLTRGFDPKIDTLEKFMDFGFMKRYLVSPTLPAIDMWQAGEWINYYSFGHFWSSIVVRYFGIDPAVGYNVMLGFVAGISMSIAFSISYLLAGAKNATAGVVAGLAGAFSTILAGNGHVIWYLIKNRGLNGYWYAEATRFIEGTIHEFPGYSFVVSDLHGHVLDLPMVLVFIFLIIHWLKNRKTIDEILMGILFGVMLMTNTWDVAVYGLLLTTVSVLLLLQNFKEIGKLVKSAGVILLVAGATALPWLLTFDSISNGIAMVTERSPIWQLGVLWSVGTLVIVISLVTTKFEKDQLFTWAMCLTVILLILIPEFVYAKDIYPDHPRANTMFKLTYQASIMIGLLTGGVWGKLFDRSKKIPAWWRWPAMVIISLIFIGTMIFPTEAFTTYYGNFDNYKNINGELWLASESPGKYWAVQFLKENNDGRNLVEAVGDSYTHFNAVSVFSGIPTIQGWRVHEWLWRGGYGPVADREAEVREIYEGVETGKTKRILDKYTIGWILVSPDETGMYEISENKLRQQGEVIQGPEGTYLIKVTQ